MKISEEEHDRIKLALIALENHLDPSRALVLADDLEEAAALLHGESGVRERLLQLQDKARALLSGEAPAVASDFVEICESTCELRQDLLEVASVCKAIATVLARTENSIREIGGDEFWFVGGGTGSVIFI